MKIQALAVFLILFSVVLTFAQTKDDSIKLFPVFVNGKYGYINLNGEMIIQPQFDKANDFHNGLGLVTIEAENISKTPGHYDYILGKQGYIDATGKFVIPPEKYGFPGDFSEGLAGIQVKGINEFKSSFGYIDTTGKVIIKPQFQTVGEFHEGTADVRLANDKWGVINRQGKFIIPPIYDGTIPFFEDVGIGLTIKNKQKSPFDQKLGDFEADFYDRKGNIIAKPQYLVLGWFTERLVSIITETGTGFIDKTGKIIIEPKFREAFGFSEGLCPVLVDKNWATLIEPER